MPIDLVTEPDIFVPDATEDALQKTVEAVLAYHDLPLSEVTILLTGDDRMKDLNRQFRSIDRATDVLSFPAGMVPESPAIGAGYLGDIVISVPYAQRQAAARGHSTLDELQLLTVHGMLHLLGYDHEQEDEKGVMWSVQRHVLDRLGLQEVTPTEADG